MELDQQVPVQTIQSQKNSTDNTLSINTKRNVIIVGCVFLILIVGIISLFIYYKNPPASSGKNPVQTLQQGTNSSGKNNTLSLRIVGNHIVNAKQQTIRLIGINREAGIGCVSKHPSIIQGPTDQASVAELTNWHINTVRITMNEDCWLGINNAPKQTSGSNYRNAIIQYVKLLHIYRMYAIIDLHINAPGMYLSVTQQAMADQDHAIAYWTSVANTFKNDPAVIFEPYNEPIISTKNTQTTNPWECWLHGCTITMLNTNIYNPSAPKIHHQWQSTGMQQIVSAIRLTGATNIITLGGLAAANNFSQYLQYLPSDPKHQLATTFHNYERAAMTKTGCGPSCWDSVILPIAQQMPVITDEFGDTECQTNYADYVTQYMNWADQHGISYLPWGWTVYTGDTTCTSNHQYDLLSNWSGTPNYYGKVFYDHFAQIIP